MCVIVDVSAAAIAVAVVVFLFYFLFLFFGGGSKFLPASGKSNALPVQLEDTNAELRRRIRELEVLPRTVVDLAEVLTLTCAFTFPRQG